MTYSKNFYLSCFCFVVIAFTLLSHGHFLTGTWLYHHDSLSVMPNFHLFFNSLFQGQMPLWMPEQNAGEPLWFSAEALQSFDPVSIGVWTLSYFRHLNSMLAYQWMCYLWLLIFALGGMACSTFVYKERWIQLAVFGLLFGGPIGMSLPAASPSFLMPFRYFPWVIYFILRLEQRAQRKDAIALGLVLGFSQAGYQSIYALVFVALFILLRKISPRKLLIPLGITSLCFAPTLVAGYYMTKEIAVARVYFPSSFHFHPIKFFFGLIDFDRRMEPSYGISYIGRFALGLSILTGCHLFSPKLKSLEKTWVWFTLVALFCCMGIGWFLPTKASSFLGVRNWGYCLALFLLAASQLMVAGFRLLIEKNESNSTIKGILFSTAFVLILGRIMFDYHGRPIPVSNLLYAGLGLALLILIREQFYKSLGFIVTVLILIDVLLLASWHLPHLNRDEIPTHLLPQLNTKPLFVMEREWNFPAIEYSPLHFDGPAIHHRPSAFLEALSPSPEVAQVYALTHHFRLKRYEALIRSSLDLEKIKTLLGVGNPILHFASEIKQVKTSEEALTQMQLISKSSWFRENAVIESDLPLPILNTQFGKPGSIHVESYSQNKIKIKVSASQGGLLIYADNYTPDWRASLDGKETKIYPANLTNKSIFVPPGEHEIEFYYLPILYLIAFWIRTSLLVMGLSWGVLILFQSVPTFVIPRNSVLGAS